MSYIQSQFQDKVNGNMVNLYIDYYSQKWLAQSRFGFRIKINK